MDRRLAPFATAVLVAVGAAELLGQGPARADYAAGMSTQQQKFYDYGPSGTNSSTKGGTILDSGNPMDLMNKIRKGTAMDDATNPTDAIDAALKELNVQSSTPAAAVKAP
ncbi:hypothetical protein KBZ14_14565 [Synechococcus sp. HJ21-Hayes]|jgi:hypothetical protein|uniref:hypothetical protein n=1 Tax=unclassified Synechococcus TaxID=2626047 RepID=UPI0020CC2ACF|nr:MULTISPECIES: hypothetical protein [unclassified Synechococcus]MCP9832703.1 hypothetical protein [Synechococcus sp. JJ3a-Johnson]MCP9854080.1 hypothetical protein [Synechococcus sp. HJ21-Hayes]